MQHSSLPWRINRLLLCFVVILTALIPHDVSLAQTTTPKQLQNIRFKLPKLPPGDPPGGRRGGGGGRDSCPAVVVPLTALVPATTRSKNGKVVEDVWGLTLSERPNFWIYSPYNQGDRFNTTFVIRQKNKHGESIGDVSVKLPSRPGLMKVVLPENMPALQVNQPYHWELSIDCSEVGKGVPLKVEGMVQRINVSKMVQNQIAAETSSLGKAQQYAENGIWFEALDLLSHDEPDDPNLKPSWEELLRSVDLDPSQFTQ